MIRIKYMSKEQKEIYNLEQYPILSMNSIIEELENGYSEKDYLVRNGQWIYKVPKEIYDLV